MKVEALKSTRKRNAKLRDMVVRHPSGFVPHTPEIRALMDELVKSRPGTYRIVTKDMFEAMR